MPNERLGTLSATFRKGIFDIKADSYVEPGNGVPFIRITDIKTGIIQKEKTAWIDHTAHAIEMKTALKRGDLVLSKTAYPAAALVNLADCNVSQDTIAVRLTSEAKKTVRPGYIAAFLNSSYGLAQMARRFQGNVQQHLSLEDGKSIRIPLFSILFQNKIQGLVESADDQQAAVLQAMQSVEELLLTILGIADWSPPEPLAYTARAADVVASKRFDAQYFMPAKEQVKQSLAALPGRPLSERVDNVREQWIPNRVRPDMQVRNYDVTDALEPLLDDDKEISCAEEIGSMKKKLQDGDVAVSRLRAYLKEIAVVRTGGHPPAVGSSEFIVLRPRAERLTPETLMVFLRSLPVQTILKWCQDGSQHPRFSENDLLAIPLPEAVLDASAEVTELVQQAFSAKGNARTLLEAAKRAVEIAVEEDEARALEWLEVAVEEI